MLRSLLPRAPPARWSRARSPRWHHSQTPQNGPFSRHLGPFLKCYIWPLQPPSPPSTPTQRPQHAPMMYTDGQERRGRLTYGIHPPSPHHPSIFKRSIPLPQIRLTPPPHLPPPHHPHHLTPPRISGVSSSLRGATPPPCSPGSATTHYFSLHHPTTYPPAGTPTAATFAANARGIGATPPPPRACTRPYRWV